MYLLFRLLTFDFVNSFLTYIVWSSPFNSSEAAITKPFIAKASFPAEPFRRCERGVAGIPNNPPDMLDLMLDRHFFAFASI